MGWIDLRLCWIEGLGIDNNPILDLACSFWAIAIVIINIQFIKIGDPEQNQTMLKLNSVFVDFMGDSSAHPDWIFVWIEVKNGHVVAVGNSVFSASEFDVDGLVKGASFRADVIITRAKVDQAVFAKTFFMIDLDEVITFAKINFDFAINPVFDSEGVLATHPFFVKLSGSGWSDFGGGISSLAVLSVSWFLGSSISLMLPMRRPLEILKLLFFAYELIPAEEAAVWVVWPTIGGADHIFFDLNAWIVEDALGDQSVKVFKSIFDGTISDWLCSVYPIKSVLFDR